jgi:hypothetical protein
MVCVFGIFSSGSGQGRLAGPCEHNNEPSGFMQVGEIFDHPDDLSVDQEGVCRMELQIRAYIHMFVVKVPAFIHTLTYGFVTVSIIFERPQ